MGRRFIGEPPVSPYVMRTWQDGYILIDRDDIVHFDFYRLLPEAQCFFVQWRGALGMDGLI